MKNNTTKPFPGTEQVWSNRRLRRPAGRERLLEPCGRQGPAHLGQRGVVPGLQSVAGDSDGLPVCMNSRWQGHLPPGRGREGPGVGKALGDVTEHGGFKGDPQRQRLRPPHLCVEREALH